MCLCMHQWVCVSRYECIAPKLKHGVMEEPPNTKTHKMQTNPHNTTPIQTLITLSLCHINNSSKTLYKSFFSSVVSIFYCIITYNPLSTRCHPVQAPPLEDSSPWDLLTPSRVAPGTWRLQSMFEMDTIHAGLLYKTLRRFHVFVKTNHLIFEIDLLVVKLLWIFLFGEVLMVWIHCGTIAGTLKSKQE